MIPARVKVMDGLLIEPHFLERNKEIRKEPQAELMESKEGKEDVSRGSVIGVTSSVEHKDANLDLSNLISIEETLPSFEGAISESKIDEVNANFNNYETSIDDTTITELSSSRLDFESLINDAALFKPSSMDNGSIPLSNLNFASVSIFNFLAVFLIDLGLK